VLKTIDPSSRRKKPTHYYLGNRFGEKKGNMSVKRGNSASLAIARIPDAHNSASRKSFFSQDFRKEGKRQRSTPVVVGQKSKKKATFRNIKSCLEKGKELTTHGDYEK